MFSPVLTFIDVLLFVNDVLLILICLGLRFAVYFTSPKLLFRRATLYFQAFRMIVYLAFVKAFPPLRLIRVSMFTLLIFPLRVCQVYCSDQSYGCVVGRQ